MARLNVLVEVSAAQPEAFAMHRVATSSSTEPFRQAEMVAGKLAGLRLEIDGDVPPVRVFSKSLRIDDESAVRLAAFANPEPNTDQLSQRVVVSAVVDERRIAGSLARPGVRAFANSRLTLFPHGPSLVTFDARADVDAARASIQSAAGTIPEQRFTPLSKSEAVIEVEAPPHFCSRMKGRPGVKAVYPSSHMQAYRLEMEWPEAGCDTWQ